MTHLNKLHQKYGKRGLTVIGVSGEEPEKVQRFNVHHTQMEYKVFLEVSIANPGYPNKFIPAVFLIGADGKCLWQGDPGSMSDRKIDQYLNERSQAFSKGYQGAPATAISNFLAGQLPNAYKAALKASKEEKKPEKLEAAKKLVAFLEGLIKQKMSYAERLWGTRDYLEARALYSQIAKEYKDTPFSAQASEKLREFEKEGVKKEIKAQTQLEQILNTYLTGKRNKKNLALGAHDLEQFANSVEGTRAADKARAMAKVFNTPFAGS